MTCLKFLSTIVWLLLVAALPVELLAHQSSEQTLDEVAFSQKIGQHLPENLVFHNARGEAVPLNALARKKPLVLVLSWFECPNLCPMMLDKLAEAAKRLPFGTDEYNVAVISIDPGEGAVEAQKFRQRLTRDYGDVMRDWQFLTSTGETIETTAEAVGFRHAYDPQSDAYAHPAGFVVIAPGGRINRYILGIEPNTPDLRLALLEAGDGAIGSPVDQVVLRCYRFDPDSGQYNLAVMRLLQGAGGTFILAMVLLVWWMRRRGAP